MRYSDELLKELINRHGIQERIPLGSGKTEIHWIVRIPLVVQSSTDFENSPYDLLMVVWEKNQRKKGDDNRYSYVATIISSQYNLVLHSELLDSLKELTNATPKVFYARAYLYAITPITSTSLDRQLYLVIENSYGMRRAIRLHLYAETEYHGSRVIYPIYHNLVRRTHREYEERKLPLREELEEGIKEVGTRIEPLLEKKVSVRRLYRLLGDIRVVYRVSKDGKHEVKDYPIGKAIVEAIRREYGTLPTLRDVLVEVSYRISKKETGLTQSVRRKVRNRLASLIREVEELSYKGITPIVL